MEQEQKKHRRRAYLITFLAIAVLSLTAPFSGLLVVHAQQGPAAEQGGGDLDSIGFPGKTNPRAAYWREVREGGRGTTAASGLYTTDRLIQNGGENWRALRNGPVATYGAWLLGIAIVGIAGYYLIRGSVRLHGRSGMTVERWSGLERLLHWVTAISFILLAITGLSLLYGRAVLIPVVGKDAFAAYAQAAKWIHNVTGVVFAVSLVLFLLKLLPISFPQKGDLKWLLKGGEYFGAHDVPQAGKSNPGEKIWYWALATVGMAMVVSGIIWDFPMWLNLEREPMQIVNLIHATSALLIMAMSFGHIYLGTLGTEHTLTGMLSGRVDTEWAKQHHGKWYKELEAKGVKPEPAETGGAAPMGGQPAHGSQQ
jgi:formate dehydrogenase subunit gamma